MDGIDLTKLLGGGGVGIVLLVAGHYFLKHLERRDAIEAARAEGFAVVTRHAVETMREFLVRADTVLAAVERLSAQVRAVDERLARIEAHHDGP